MRLRAKGAPTDYRPSLDLATAVSNVTYVLGVTTYTRKIFSSTPASVHVIRLESSKSGGLSLDHQIDRSL